MATPTEPATMPTMPVNTTKRAPRRATSGPPSAMPTIEPADSPAMIKPIWPVEAPVASRISGVRVTHVAMDRPVTKNAANIAARRRAGVRRGEGTDTPGLAVQRGGGREETKKTGV